jgi:hypothetical protein
MAQHAAGCAGKGLGQTLEVGVGFAHVGWHPGRKNPVKPPQNPITARDTRS